MKTIKLSLWFMTDMHTFRRLQGKTLNELKECAIKTAKKHPYGMVCNPTLIINGVETSNGCNYHVDKNGKVEISKWIKTVKQILLEHDLKLTENLEI